MWKGPNCCVKGPGFLTDPKDPVTALGERPGGVLVSETKLKRIENILVLKYSSESSSHKIIESGVQEIF